MEGTPVNVKRVRKVARLDTVNRIARITLGSEATHPAVHRFCLPDKAR